MMTNVGLRLRLGPYPRLCAFLEQQAIFEQAMAPPTTDAYNHAVNRYQVATLICPSDIADGPLNQRMGKLNYALCVGDNQINQDHTGTYRFSRGIFAMLAWPTFADILDGTSNTIARAEIVRPAAQGDFGDIANLNSAFTLSQCVAAYNVADHRYMGTSFAVHRGWRWADAHPYFTVFQTLLPPNSPSCSSTSGWAALAGTQYGVFSASSRHPGGCNVLLADGSVRFISETIDAGSIATAIPSTSASGRSLFGVWGALGTKAGKESASAP